MIVTSLIGGLGNQLFQYATARNLSLKLNTSLGIDISSFLEYKLHKFSLEPLNIKLNFLDLEELKKFKIFKEPKYTFNPEIFQQTGDVLLKGYWQSEKYFKENRKILLEEINVKSPLIGIDKEVASLILNSNSILLHVRRTDYVAGSYSDQILEALNLEYYYKAIELIKSKLNSPHFFIFSDDISWVKEHLKINESVTYVGHNNADKNFEDLRLMSLCKHAIIANSSFSWWGAWLNQNQNKIIISPKKWFSQNARNLDCKDLIPAEWIRI